MSLVDEGIDLTQAPFEALAPGRTSERAERAARHTLRTQIAKLERELSESFVTAFPMGGLELYEPRYGQPRLLSLGELERIRDDLANRLRAARIQIAQKADAYAVKRVELEKMLLDPGKYRFQKITLAELGEPGCGAWEAKPRLGLIGMLAGWWHVKLSSGCPLARGRGERRDPLRASKTRYERRRLG